MQPLYAKLHDRGFTVVAVERSRDTKRARALIDEHKLTYTCLENGQGDAEVVRKVFKVGSFPTSFLIDREGRVRTMHVGFAPGDEERLEKEIQELLGGQGTPG